MSRFEEALEAVLRHEGGYNLHADDPGGESYRGVARRRHPEWPGWARVEAAKGRTTSLAELARALDADELLQRDVAAFYRTLWVQGGYHRLDAQEIADKVFDLVVLTGGTQGHRLLQRALRAVGRPVIEDGVLGPKTVEAANRAPRCCLLAALRSESACFLRSLRSAAFETGWLRRAYDEV